MDAGTIATGRTTIVAAIGPKTISTAGADNGNLLKHLESASLPEALFLRLRRHFRHDFVVLC